MESQCSAWILLTAAQVDPGEITSRVGLKPTQVWRVGDSVQGTLIRRTDCGWAIGLQKVRCADLSVVVEQLLRKIQGALKEIERIRIELELDIEISCQVMFQSNAAPSIHFDALLVKRIAKLGAELDIDIELVSQT